MAHAYHRSTLGGQDGWIMRSRDRDHPGQQGETPSLLKIQKLYGCRYVVLTLMPLFCSIGLYLCFGTSTMLF